MDKVDIISKVNKLLLSADVVDMAEAPKENDVSVVEVVVIGILLVFFILVLITLIMMVFPHLLGNGTKKDKKETANTAEAVPNIQTVPVAQVSKEVNNNDDELISVITAAICAYRSSIGESSEPSSFRVVAFKKALRKWYK